MTTSTPPPSSLARAVELDNVRDVMLLEAAEQMRAEPIPRHEGPPAPLGRLEARLRTSRASEDFDAERMLSLELSRVHFDHYLDIDMAVQLLHRALEIEDDRDLRRDLARRLATMGRHVEAGHVLRDGEPATKEEVFDSWLASGEAYARAGDADEAVATFREAAMVFPESPLPFARIAEVAYWAPEVVPPERAADAWLEASKRFELGSNQHGLAIIRAFEVAPTYARSTEAYTSLLRHTGRRREADAIWREYGVTSGHASSVAVRRAKTALKRDDIAIALAATLEGHIAAISIGREPDIALDELLRDGRVMAWLASMGADEDIADTLSTAVSARSNLARADSLAIVARTVEGEARAVLWSLASDAYAGAGDADQACRAAIEACTAAPWLPHAQATLMAVGADERVSLADIERAVGRLPSRSSLLKLAATRFDGHGLALIYDRRLASIRPCDLLPLETLLNRAVRLGQADAVGDAISHVLDTPRPWYELSEALADALAFLASCDQARALDLAKRVLALIGPGNGNLYETIREIAQRADDHEAEIAMVLGRAVSDQIPDEERAIVYLEAAAISLERGDVQSAAVHTSRAAAHSGELERIMDAIAHIHGLIPGLEPSRQSDANIALARANAWAAEQQDTQAAVEAWRYLGALRWDLADDHIGADEAFFVACAIDPETGPYRYAIDLRDRAGAGDAFPLIVERAVNVEHEGAEARLFAKLYAAAARVAADAGMRELAIDAAVAAVRADPSRGDAVAIVEKAADGEQGLTALNFVYDTLADAALGRYGFRAAHYRAARQLEKLRAYDDALRHAIQAFEAVPSVGASYRMLLRLAERTGNEEAAVSTLASVASTFPLDRQLSWLVRAAELAHRSQTGRELRVELLLKAFVLKPSVEIIEMLGQAAEDTLALPDPTGGDLVRDRLERAIHAALPKLKGHQAGAVAVALSAMAAGVLANASLAIEALMRGLELNVHDIDVAAVVEHAPLLASETVLARTLLGRVNDIRTDPSKQLSASVKDLTSKLYLELSDVTPPPATPVPRDEVVGEAHLGEPDFDQPDFDHLGQPDLEQPGLEQPDLEQPERNPKLDDLERDDDEGPDSGDMVTQRPPEGFDERAHHVPVHPASPAIPTPTDSDEALLDAQLEALVDGDDEANESNLFDAHFDAIESSDGRPSDPGNIVRIVAQPPLPEEHIQTRRPPPGVPQPDTLGPDASGPEGPDAVGPDAHEQPDDAALPTEKARAHEEPPSSDVVDLDDEDFVAITNPPPDEAVEALDEAAVVAAASVSEPAGAMRSAQPDWVAKPSESDARIDFSPESEAAARERGDHAAIADMLSARLAATDNPEQRRLIRLRRAAVLEQRLNRIHDACAELELILEESGDDPTALRYLADLRDRQERHARAAKLWLRASQSALHLDEKIRDVARCCESLVKAGRPETAKKLIDAARGLPQSPRLLKLRITVARRLDDAQELAAAEAELAALGASRRDPPPSSPPAELLAALDSTPPEEGAPRRSSTIPPRRPSQPPEALALAARGDGRNVFRVTNAPPPELGDASRSAADTLEACRRSFVERGPQGAREAKRTIRRLRSIASELLERDRDLYTYLLVECFDAAQGTGAATHALQQHWEHHGGTPLVTTAVADRLVRRGELRPALLLYQRVLGKDLRGVRDDARIAIEAAELAHRAADHEHAAFFLTRALDEAPVRLRAEAAIAEWYPDGLPQFPTEMSILDGDAATEALSRRTPVVQGPSKTPTDAPPPPTADPPERSLADHVLNDDDGSEAPDDEVADDEEPPSEAPPSPQTAPVDAPTVESDPVPLDRLSLSDDGTAVEIEPSPPSVASPSGPPSLRHATEAEEGLFQALVGGSFEAGDELAALYEQQGDRRLLDLVTVRRLQATIHRGRREVLERLMSAAQAANADAYATSVEHVLYAFDADHAPPEPPQLNQLAAQPEATHKLLFHHLDGTINEALAIVCDSGMMRRELSDYDFTGTDRVPPVATTPVGRCYAALTRLIDLGSTRLFHRSRSRGRLDGRVALLSPLAAILSGSADRETATLRYVLGSALAAASPLLALLEGLDEEDARNLIQALHAGFGPVDDASIHETSQAQMRIAEDLWHMVGSAADHRLRELCNTRGDMSYETGKELALRTRRRAGLFACGDLVTAIMQVVHELDLAMPRPIRGAQALETLCKHPEVRDLYDLALLPEFADARWQIA